MNTLPDLPSALIRVALADLAKVEGMPEKYEIDMGNWHLPTGSKCAVCLAGSVMAMSLGADPSEALSPSELDGHQKLWALNEFRVGDVGAGLALLDGREDYDPHSLNRDITPYLLGAHRFRRDMESLASDLEAAGL